MRDGACQSPGAICKSDFLRSPGDPMTVTIARREVIVRGRLLRIGSPVGDRFDYFEDAADFIGEARVTSPSLDVFTFVQPLPTTERQYPYAVEWDNFAALSVSTFEDWWTRQIDNKTRNMVRKAEKQGVQVREVAFDDALVAGICDIYNETPIRQGKRFWHYGKDVATVARENGSFLDHSVFIGAFVDGQVVGFVKLVLDRRGGQAGMMQILSMLKHRDKAPTNALISQAVRSCAARGIPHLVYAQFAYGKKQYDSLVAFKQSNGFKRVDVPRYYVPLTKRGTLAMNLGLHHRISDRIPEGLLGRFRELRGLWYARKFPMTYGGR
jgi:hypothetical protein